MTTPPPPSPAAQAVRDAVLNETSPVSEQHQQRMDAAAVIRALVEATLPEDLRTCETYTTEAIRLNRMGIRAKQLAIAAELEGGNTTTEANR